MPAIRATGVLRAPSDLLGRMQRDVERNALRARNGIKLAAGATRAGAQGPGVVERALPALALCAATR